MLESRIGHIKCQNKVMNEMNTFKDKHGFGKEKVVY